MNEKQFDDLSNKLEVIMKLLAAQTVHEMSRKQAIIHLSTFGFKPKDIADLLSTTPNTVSVTLSKLRKVKLNGKKTKK